MATKNKSSKSVSNKKTAGKTTDLKPRKDVKGGFTMVERSQSNLPAVQRQVNNSSSYKTAG